MRRSAVADAARYGGACVEIVERSVRLELAAALRLTESTAARLLHLAEALVGRYRIALESLWGARMTDRHAEAIVDAFEQREERLRDELLPVAVCLAEKLPLGSFRRALRKLIEAESEATLAERFASAITRRRVVVDQPEEGMAWLHALVPAVEAQASSARLTAMAKVFAADPAETRTLDQIRADILCDLLVEGDTAIHPDGARGIRATVSVTVPVLALLDAEAGERTRADGGAESAAGVARADGVVARTVGADRAGAAEAGDRIESDRRIGDSTSGGARRALSSAWVEGLGPIPIDVARDLCAGADGWMRVLTHPETGVVLSVGRTQYAPPPAMRRLAKWRADRCMAPGCGIPAARCELDHTIAWEHGGETSLDNLAPLCKGHHTVKHHGGWTVKQVDGAGAIEWTSPHGRRYVVEPERRVPMFRPSREPAPF
ncbi:HNH endonuclease signature motif containing protein [Microbacterium terrae]|nr:HNH endonuclease signature motif containing protein [Microbacterium terrae]